MVTTYALCNLTQISFVRIDLYVATNPKTLYWIINSGYGLMTRTQLPAGEIKGCFSLRCSGNHGAFCLKITWVKRPGLKLTSHLHLVLRLRIRGFLSPGPYMSLWHNAWLRTDCSSECTRLHKYFIFALDLSFYALAWTFSFTKFPCFWWHVPELTN
jgi:hypothetical protein